MSIIKNDDVLTIVPHSINRTIILHHICYERRESISPLDICDRARKEMQPGTVRKKEYVNSSLASSSESEWQAVVPWGYMYAPIKRFTEEGKEEFARRP